MICTRPLAPEEYDFLMDMHYESIHIVEGKPPKEELLSSPHLIKYSENWGRPGDRALIALVDDIPAGAVWYRLFDENNKGYGFVDAHTPELGIAILASHRQQGLGMRLMEAIIQQAICDGYPALSLSVDPHNRAAVRLYERLGFSYCGTSGTSWTMKLDLDNS